MHSRTRQSRISIVSAAVLLIFAAGCTTKNYVRTQTAPLAEKTNELEDASATNHRNLQDVDSRAQQGITQAQGAANQADQHATAAGMSATKAQQSAQEAVNRVDSLASAVANLDNYQQLSKVDVFFAFNQDLLTKTDREQLDALGTQLGNARGYLLEITGATDSVGAADYNYQLSERRAQAVVQYLAAKYNVPAHKFYLIGVGKDMAVASNSSAAGRAKNRRVAIRLLSNSGLPQATQSASNPPPS